MPGLHAAELRRGPFLQIATPDSITVRWRTDVPCESVVRCGAEAGALTSSVTDSNLITEHEVRLTDLTPATQYFYSVGSLSETHAEGTNCYFITHPVPGPAAPTRVWVISDSGQTADPNTSLSVRDAYYRYAGTNHTDVWLALGDNSYCYGTDLEYQTNFFAFYPEMFQRTAIWPAIGNHETWWTWMPPVSPRMPYLDIFTLPTNGEAGGVPSGKEEYYSFDYANIHFICLDSMTQSRATNGPMADWLRADLAATTNLWIITFFHHAPYSKGTHDSDDPWSEVQMVEMRENIVPILEAAGVDLVLSGHSHMYERSYLLRGHYGYSPTLRPEMILDQGSGREADTGPYVKTISGPGANCGTVYVQTGCSGSLDTPYGHHPVMFHDESQLGSFVLDINSNRLDAVFLRSTGEVGDWFTMIKKEPEPFRLFHLALQEENIILSWKSDRGMTYQIEQTDSGTASNWETASAPITATGPITSWTNLVAPGPMHLYRVIQIPPLAPVKRFSPVKVAESTGLGWEVGQQPITLASLSEQQFKNPPIYPEEREPLGIERQYAGVVCDTTYWKRNVKPQVLRGRLASSTFQGTQAACRVSWLKQV